MSAIARKSLRVKALCTSSFFSALVTNWLNQTSGVSSLMISASERAVNGAISFQ